MNDKLILTKALLNQWGRDREPFFLLADFELEQVRSWRIRDIDPEQLRFEFNVAKGEHAAFSEDQSDLDWQVEYPTAERYAQAFSLVQKGLHRGDSFLLNLTSPSQVHTNWSLEDIYQRTEARYKIWWKDKFVVFSPEIFVQIRNGKIFSHPMKGTLAGHLPAEILLNDPKEKAEHATIVDLIRNDLSQVAQKVRVDKYRYLEHIPTAQGGLWQTSSEISGELPCNYHHQLGDLIFQLLPAGSISGAPKTKTVEIIRAAEQQKRGYYTGIAAYWNGYELDSCVLIRFLEKEANGLRYWSGGGITAYSSEQEEYKELKEKVYLPLSTAVHKPFTVADTFE
ncbi:MAG: aminodeoxychorismate synthase component I [Bacteroidota bacterium]